jgi:hypothetical protein
MRREDVPYSVDGISESVRVRFSRYEPETLLFHPDRLLCMRDIVLRDQEIDECGLLAAGAEILEQDALREEFLRKHKEQVARRSLKSHGSPKKFAEVEHRRVRSKIDPKNNCVLTDAVVNRSCSSKINYIINEACTKELLGVVID